MPKHSDDNSRPSVGRPRLFRDFNLRFGWFDESKNTFKVWVEGPVPGGTMRPDHAAERLYDPTAIWDDPAHGVGGPLDALERRNLGRDDLFKLGWRLADLALPEGEVLDLFQRSLDAVTRFGRRPASWVSRVSHRFLSRSVA
jgi:hypothetical protein